MYFLGIEIGGTKLQLGIGPGDGTLAGLWRETVDAAAGPEGIRRQISRAIPELLAKSAIDRSQLGGIGIGFGGPVDDTAHTIIKSHQIEGWDNFPLQQWISDLAGMPAALGNEVDCAGLAEALFGAGKGLSPIFYITIGSGIGGGLIVDGQIYRGVGRGAAGIGHVRVPIPSQGGFRPTILEKVASGWGIEAQARSLAVDTKRAKKVLELANGKADQITAMPVPKAAAEGHGFPPPLLYTPSAHPPY